MAANINQFLAESVSEQEDDDLDLEKLEQNLVTESDEEESDNNENEKENDDDSGMNDSFWHDKYESKIEDRIKHLENEKDNDNENDENDEATEQEKERKRKENEVNWLSIPWEGDAPKIIFKNDEKTGNTKNGNKNKDETNNREKQIRKIWFARNMKDKNEQSIYIWDIPLSWNEKDISNIFSMFGKIKSVTLQNTRDIINRHCMLKFEDCLSVDTSLAYDSRSIIQPYYQGSVSLGTKKWLSNYIHSRLRNVDKLEKEINKFMKKYDELNEKRISISKMQPRRLRGWIQTRTEDGWTNIHYPNKFERKKHKAFRVGGDNNEINMKLNQTQTHKDDNKNNNNHNSKSQNRGNKKKDKNNNNKRQKKNENNSNVKIHPINPNDTMNAPPVKKMYDKSRKKDYYSINQIKDTYTTRYIGNKKKQEKMKQQVKESMKSNNNNNKNGIANVRLKKSMLDRTQWKKDLSNTTKLRKNRRFKPSG